MKFFILEILLFEIVVRKTKKKRSVGMEEKKSEKKEMSKSLWMRERKKKMNSEK